MGTLYEEPLVRTINITMPDRLGFHLRAVARFVRCVLEFRSRIHIRKGKVFADEKSVLGVLILGASWKSQLEIQAVGDDAVQAMECIKDFFSNQKNIRIGQL